MSLSLRLSRSHRTMMPVAVMSLLTDARRRMCPGVMAMPSPASPYPFEKRRESFLETDTWAPWNCHCLMKLVMSLSIGASSADSDMSLSRVLLSSFVGKDPESGRSSRPSSLENEDRRHMLAARAAMEVIMPAIDPTVLVIWNPPSWPRNR